MRTIIVIFFCCVQISISQNIWFKGNSERMGQKMLLTVASDSVIFLLVEKVIEKPNGSFNLHSAIFKSTDTGFSWKEIFEYNAGNPRNIFALNTANVYFTIGGGSLFTSKDGALSFERKIFEEVENDHFTFDHIIMLDSNVGFATQFFYFLTFDGWNSYVSFTDYFDIEIESNWNMTLRSPHFLTDSLLICYSEDYSEWPSIFSHHIITANIFTKKIDFFKISDFPSVDDFTFSNLNTFFLIGSLNIIDGGSSHDAIYKSSDGGRTWRNVLDLYANRPKIEDNSPFGLQQIAFKDSLTGIAVGQFGKIVYTYDGGETWIYETEYHPSMRNPNPTPSVMKIRYAGSVPIIATNNGDVYRLVEDNLAPKPEDTCTFSGRVWLDSATGQGGIPVALGNRICMTDSLGFYKFTRVSPGKHTLRALNKYFEGKVTYYKPYDYAPEVYNLEGCDASSHDFFAIDLLNSVERSAPWDNVKLDLYHNTETLTLNIISNLVERVSISLISTTGIALESKEVQLSHGYTTQNIDISNLSSGVYFVIIEQNGVVIANGKVALVR